jgi:hypothetical protein
MINVADLARRLSTAVGRPAGGGLRLGAEDVLGYLRSRSSASFELEHGAAAVERIDAALSTLPRLIVEERLPKQHPGFVRYFEAAPRIVFMTARGYSSEEIANSMNFLATEYGVDAVLGIVADAIAKRLRKG